MTLLVRPIAVGRVSRRGPVPDERSRTVSKTSLTPPPPPYSSPETQEQRSLSTSTHRRPPVFNRGDRFLVSSVRTVPTRPRQGDDTNGEVDGGLHVVAQGVTDRGRVRRENKAGDG